MPRPQTFEKPLPVGKTGNYVFRTDAKWLASASITNPVVTAPGVTISQVVAVGNEIQFRATGLTAGLFVVEFEWSTSDGRSDCGKAYLSAIEC